MSTDDILHGLYRHRNGRMVRIDAPPAIDPLPVESAAPEAPTAADVSEPGPVTESVKFDPAEHSVAEVFAFLVEHPEQTDAVIEAERNGKNRKSIVGA